MKPGCLQNRFLFMGVLLALVVPTAYAQTVYWTDVGTGKIQRANLVAGTGVEDLVTTQVIEPVGLALDLVASKIYWTEASPADFMISRANLDGTNVELLVTGLDRPSGITLDVAGGKLYWTDIGTSKIQRANLDGSSVEDLLTVGVVFTPVEIALDTAGHKIYWTESTLADFMIQRADLDGSNVELLVTDLVSPSGIALDVAGGKIYWTDIGTGKIQRANLDGTGVEDLVTTGSIEPVRIALDLTGGKMYWTDGSLADFMISRANLDGTGGEFLITGLTSPSGIALELQAEGPGGACCFGFGFCGAQTQEQCESVEDQLYLGDGTKCLGDLTCPAVCVNCECVDGSFTTGPSAIGCVSEEIACADSCQAQGGVESFQCDLGPCVAIPAVSQWGIMVMTLLVLTAGTLVLARATVPRMGSVLSGQGRPGHPPAGVRRDRRYSQEGSKKMKTSQSQAILVTALASTFTLQAAAQTTFSHDNTIAITAVGAGEDLLTEGAPGPPVVAIGGASLGLLPGDHIYFSLARGSPTLAAIAATPGDILYSDLSAAAPVIATLGGGAGLATAANLGIALSDLDALSLVGTTGSVGGGGGVIATGSVGAAPANTGAVSTHFLEFSVTRGGGAVGFAGEVLVRTGAGVAAVFVPAEEGLGLGFVNEDELNALEVIPTPMIPTVSQWGIMVMTSLVLTADTLVLRTWPLAAHCQERNAKPVS